MLFSKKLHQFISLAKNNSIHQAAKEINITPSAVSQGLFSLEKKLGTQLLIRKNNRVTLSRDGIDLFNKIIPHVEAINTIVNKSISFNNTGKFKVLTDGFPLNDINKLFNSLNKNAGIKKIDIEYNLSTGIEREINNNIYDMIISPSNIELKNNNIIKASLKTETIGLVISKDLIRNSNIEKIISKSYFIQTPTFFKHIETEKIINKLELKGIKMNMLLINEMNIFPLLESNKGYSFFSESYFCKNNHHHNNLIFLTDPFVFF
ncbi:LysR family transcriptional regulator [Serratia quinivorans]|uniref:LysR family transcriptional regulator n=1 Tax=Serratia quinivorans TaxID=137545 RepID=UPI00107EDB18|nr:LysR family transcriptional regulator [Serratia quinivorans]QBX68328.1 LysR family transcriptional regulator [Serratia quinivorans]